MSMSDDHYLEGQLLLAMPGIGDPRFERAVILLCQHSPEGAMGLIINRPFQRLSVGELLQQLEVEPGEEYDNTLVHAGGPVEPSRGFVVHSNEYEQPSTLKITDQISLTATLDILRDMAQHRGPKRSLVALGYAGWSPGQLDKELTRHGWLSCPASEAIVFDAPMDQKWSRAMSSIGIDVRMLSGEAGHA